MNLYKKPKHQKWFPFFENGFHFLKMVSSSSSRVNIGQPFVNDLIYGTGAPEMVSIFRTLWFAVLNLNLTLTI